MSDNVRHLPQRTTTGYDGVMPDFSYQTLGEVFADFAYCFRKGENIANRLDEFARLTALDPVPASISDDGADEDGPDERGGCGHCDVSWRLCRGLLDRTGVPCCADCAQFRTHPSPAPQRTEQEG